MRLTRYDEKQQQQENNTTMDFTEISSEITAKIGQSETFLTIGVGLMVVFIGYKLIKRAASKI